MLVSDRTLRRTSLSYTAEDSWGRAVMSVHERSTRSSLLFWGTTSSRFLMCFAPPRSRSTRASEDKKMGLIRLSHRGGKEDGEDILRRAECRRLSLRKRTSEFSVGAEPGRPSFLIVSRRNVPLRSSTSRLFSLVKME